MCDVRLCACRNCICSIAIRIARIVFAQQPILRLQINMSLRANHQSAVLPKTQLPWHNYSCDPQHTGKASACTDTQMTVQRVVRMSAVVIREEAGSSSRRTHGSCVHQALIRVSPFHLTFSARFIIASRHCIATIICLIEQSGFETRSRCFIPADSCFSFTVLPSTSHSPRCHGDRVWHPTNIACAFQTVRCACFPDRSLEDSRTLWCASVAALDRAAGSAGWWAGC
jgi:hypothetical protein